MVNEERGLFKQVYAAYARNSVGTLMMRIVTERAFSAKAIDAVHARVAERQTTREIVFSAMVEIMLLVVMGTRASAHAAWQKNKDLVGASVQALYEKLAGVEPEVDRALLLHVGRRCADLVTELGGAYPRTFPAFPLRIVDGMHIEHTEKRLHVLRDVAVGPRPGFALAVYDAERDLIVDALFETDAHAQERSRFPDLLSLARAGECWMGDRNFCTVGYVLGLVDCGAHPLIRQHGSFPWVPIGLREAAGRCATGAVFQQRIEVLDARGKARKLWRVSVVLDEPTRDGDAEIHLITDLLDHGVTAVQCADAYRERWSIEGCFLTMAKSLNAEINTLGYPPAALFALAIGFCAFNVLSTVQAALRAEHGHATIDEGLSVFALVEEARVAWQGLNIVLPQDLWAPYRRAPTAEIALELRTLARAFSLDNGYRKSRPRAKKKKPPAKTRFKHKRHIATQRLLDESVQDNS